MFKSRHHEVYNGLEWSLRPDAKAIRENPALIKRMYWEQHQEIHAHTVAVPLLGFYALQRTRKLFEPQSTHLGSLENLMSSIETAAMHPRSHDIESQLALLAIDALDLQRPFIAAIELAERRSIIDLSPDGTL